MALLVNIEDLLNKRKVEDNRIEFKRGWNPDSIYHTICAFANDIDNLGGGYILIGVEEENGVAKRPVCGIEESALDSIQKEMQGYNAKFNPYYLPRSFVEVIDGKNVFVIWAPSGVNRPYSIPISVTSKQSNHAFYIRSGSSSIVAKGEVLNELRDLASRVPFDERPNPDIKLSDISLSLISDYLEQVGSSIPADEITIANKLALLEQMDLMSGPNEDRKIKNVAAMMFCEHPEKFFPYCQIEIAIFPEGRINNPDHFIESIPFTGPVTKVIKDALSFLRTNVLKEKVIKTSDSAKSKRFYNYPFQSLEEAIVNAMYHRDYQVYEPVEITIEPDMMTILSFSGPDRSISLEAIRKADILKSRRYRNRRLGEFLKELGLTEGRATGIPTIQKHLRNNQSGRAVIHTDEERSFFMLEIPCNKEFVNSNLIDFITAPMSQVVSQVKPIHIDADFQQIKSQISQVLSQVVSQDKPLNLDLLTKVYMKLTAPMSMHELMIEFKQTNRGRFKRSCLDILLDANLITMTIPDKPNSSKQRYKQVQRF